MVITVTNVNTNSIAGNSLLYKSLGDVFVNIGTDSRGETTGGVTTGSGTVVVVLSGTTGTVVVLSGTGFGTVSFGLSMTSAGWSSGIGLSWIFWMV